MATVACNTNLNDVFSDECLGGSLLKINSNFNTLQNILWTLRERVDSRVEVRTFFYYGPNSVGPAGLLNEPAKGVSQTAGTSPAASGMDDGKISRPSNLTIQAFINSSSQINLPSISSPGDIAYVIFQKTGQAVQTTSGPVFVASNSFYLFQGSKTTSAGQSVTTDKDIRVDISPIFIIWKLTCSNLLTYLVDQGFPKFHRAQTLQQTSKLETRRLNVNVPQPLSWDQPQNWSPF